MLTGESPHISQRHPLKGGLSANLNFVDLSAVVVVQSSASYNSGSLESKASNLANTAVLHVEFVSLSPFVMSGH